MFDELLEQIALNIRIEVSELSILLNELVVLELARQSTDHRVIEHKRGLFRLAVGYKHYAVDFLGRISSIYVLNM